MKRVGIRELKEHASEIIKHVTEQQESVELTVRGQPVAVIMPIEKTDPERQRREFWETIQATLSTAREQRLAFLLFHCGLKPGEIMYFYSQEFSDIQELYQLRYSIFEELHDSVLQIH